MDSAKEEGQPELLTQTRDVIRTHMAENQETLRTLQDKLRLSQEDADMQAKRRTEVEKVLAKRDAAYEELLEKTASKQDMAVEDIKVGVVFCS
jgi:kinesin family protein 5